MRTLPGAGPGARGGWISPASESDFGDHLLFEVRMAHAPVVRRKNNGANSDGGEFAVGEERSSSEELVKRIEKSGDFQSTHSSPVCRTTCCKRLSTRRSG